MLVGHISLVERLNEIKSRITTLFPELISYQHMEVSKKTIEITPN